MRIRLVSSLGSIAAILILSGVISIIEYRRMSDYVSDLIASNIKSINLSQRLADMTQEYNHQMLSVVLLNDISLMPEFDLGLFQSQADSLKSSVTSTASLPIVDTVSMSFDSFMKTSLKFDEVFLADTAVPITLLIGGIFFVHAYMEQGGVIKEFGYFLNKVLADLIVFRGRHHVGVFLHPHIVSGGEVQLGNGG